MIPRLNPRLRLFWDGRFIAAVYALMTVIATWEKYATGHANNLLIFRASFFNLVAGRDLYALNPAQHLDYFKYSPTFALLMAPFAAAPEFPSAIAWNFCNVFALFAAIRLLSFSREQKALVLWLILIELLTSIQNFQSNALVAALIIGTFIALDRGQPEVAGLFVALGASIKIFGAAAALFALFYPGKLRFVFATLVAALLLFALPLLVIPAAQLQWQYRNWLFLLHRDYFAEEKLSIMSWLHVWFGVNWPNNIIQIVGACLMLLPIALALCVLERRSHLPVSETFRLKLLASLLVFLVIFNHKAESPMFILAVTGVAIWYAASVRSGWRTLLIVLVLLVTSVASTDLVPRFWRETISTPMVLKAVPCILAWVVMQVELLLSSRAKSRDPVAVA
jgi:hypothetical protein